MRQPIVNRCEARTQDAWMRVGDAERFYLENRDELPEHCFLWEHMTKDLLRSRRPENDRIDLPSNKGWAGLRSWNVHLIKVLAPLIHGRVELFLYWDVGDGRPTGILIEDGVGYECTVSLALTKRGPLERW